MSGERTISSKYRRIATQILKILCINLPLLLSLIILQHTTIEAADSADATTLPLKGRNLSAEEVTTLERELQAKPDDLVTRTQLLRYYSRRRFKSDSARKARQKHILWIIQNYPDAKIARRPYAHLNPILDKESYYQAKELWLKQVEIHKENTTVLGNAAAFFLIFDRDVAEDLLKKAQTLEPNNPEWPGRLGRLYMLGISRKSPEAKKELAKKALEQLEKSVDATTEEIRRFYKLSNIAKAAFEANDMEKAKTYADKLLSMAPQYKVNWNYGNAIHHGNLILGRIALKSDNIEEAKAFLLKAGETPGSPQLDSFGPNMILAKELLERGERKTVIQYFKLCAKFWKKDVLNEWIRTVEAGGMPKFGANLNY